MPIYDAPRDYVTWWEDDHEGSVYTSARLSRWQQEHLVRDTLADKYSIGAWKYYVTTGIIAAVGFLTTWGAIEAAFGAFNARTGPGATGLAVLMGISCIIAFCCLFGTWRALVNSVIPEVRVRFAKPKDTVIAINVDTDERWKKLDTSWKYLASRDGVACRSSREHILRHDPEFCRSVEPTIDHFYRSSDALCAKLAEMQEAEMEASDPYRKLKQSLDAMVIKTAEDMLAVMNMQRQTAITHKQVALESHQPEVEGLVAQAQFFLTQDPIAP